MSDAAGAANGIPSERVHSEILRVEFKPDTGGRAPTDLYEVTLTDGVGFDV